MHCPYCSYEETKVIDSRYTEEATRRRRECEKCTKRFTTYERIETTPLVIMKKDGRREPFTREKVLKGIRRACEKRPVSEEEMQTMVNAIEQKCLLAKESEISAAKVGNEVMAQLKKKDKVAYIRFASVYKEFTDPDDFTNEVKKIIKEV